VPERVARERNAGAELTATRVASPYVAASLNARVSARRSASPIAGRSSQSTRRSGALTVAKGHSRRDESVIERRAVSPLVS
jgi:hypothetical protein